MTLPATKFGMTPGMLFALGGSVALHGLVLFAIPVSPQAQGARATILQAQLLPAATSVAARKQPLTGKQQATDIPLATTLPATMELAHEPALTAAAPAAPPAEAMAGQAVAPQPANSSAYFSGEELDVPPHMLGEVQQIYPARARSAAVEGYVTLALLINEHGEVEQASVVQAQPGGYFEEAALTMLRKQRFSPPIRQNQPVKSRWLTTVRYRLQG